MNETWHQLFLLFSPEFNAPTISAGRRGLLWAYALLAAIGVGAADVVLGQGITFLPLYLLVVVPLSFYEGFFAGVAAAWLVCFISLGVDMVGRGPLAGYLLYVRTGLHLAMFIVVAAAASWIGRIYAKLKDLSIRDGLTGLYNHAYFKMRLAEELTRAARFKRPLSISLFDLDHFKSCNDTYGHEMGNELLRELADLLKGNLREVDLAARYGGDEFVVLLPETGWGRALEAAERLRGVVERHRFLLNYKKGSLAITMSGGIASFDRARSTPDLLLDAADRSLYKAKADGRNKVCG
ncbi:MAG: GGDEF domain-containing protein [Candidatus Methylomirabilis sp.]